MAPANPRLKGMNRPSKLVAVVGPTGVGKSALALALAKRFSGEVVNADSRLVYRGMDIGTAKPSREDQQAAPHHLIDIVEPTEEFNLARYLELARAAIDAIHARGGLAILAGGTGLYVSGVVEGFQAPRVPPNWALRRSLEQRVEAEGMGALLAELHTLDTDAATRIDPKNPRRIVRALEVCLETGQPFSQQRQRSKPPFDTLSIGLTMDRRALYGALDRRVVGMAAAGWLDEVKMLMAGGCGPQTPAMSALGYREIMACLTGGITLEDAIGRIQKATRRFARRQYAWFRPNDPSINWLDAVAAPAGPAADLVAEFLARGG